VDQLTREVDGWLTWTNEQFDNVPNPVIGFMRLVLSELDEIRCGLKGDAYFLEGMRHRRD
jgi:hypothetical protein